MKSLSQKVLVHCFMTVVMVNSLGNKCASSYCFLILVTCKPIHTHSVSCIMYSIDLYTLGTVYTTHYTRYNYVTAIMKFTAHPSAISKSIITS